MEEKKADNTKIENKNISADNAIYMTKQKISSLDNRIDAEKNKIRELDDMEELFVSLSKNISKCVELLNRSVKGKNVNSKLNSIEENNKINFAKSMSNIEIQREDTKNNLVKLTEEKEKYQDELKEEYQRKANEENGNNQVETEEKKEQNPDKSIKN